MKQFFSRLFRWLEGLRRILVNSLFVIIIFAYGFLLLGMQPEVPDRAALVVNPTGQIVEELETPSAMALPLSGGVATSQTSVHDLVAVIRQAASDERIHLMVLKLDEMGHSSLPLLQELRHAITDFRATGKMVIATGPNYTQSQYYLAAAANTIFLQPMGYVGIEGFSVYRNYIRDALDKLHVQAEVFRAGKYKSAIEPLLRNDMSDADRESNRLLLTTLWDSYLKDIAEMRNLRPQRLQQLLDKPSQYLEAAHGSMAELAKTEGLVDELADHGTIEEYIAGAMDITEGDYPMITFRDYLHAAVSDHVDSEVDQIGIITASGMILDGEQPAGKVGSLTMLEMLKRAEQSDKIKAVVLRIDSPGGSAQASEVIRAAVLRLQKAGKPVVVSMAGAAASGGYWMAAPADEIWASATTITGSIGAFGVMLNIQKGLEKLGVHSDGIATTTIAGGLRIDRAMPAELAKVMQLTISNVYQRFLQVVAQGRHMEQNQVAAIAEGRVWSGADAKRLGLVDHLGGFDDAVKAAARLALLGNHYQRTWIKPPQGFIDLLMAQFMGNAEALFPGVWQNLSYLTMASQVTTAPLSPALLHQLSGRLGLPLYQPGALTLSNLRVE
ncbi:MAG: signal peptide peptidase SppA [Mariprofundus sp.]|nr:signal peptide peptidase SppA [Mariprofundus sp.]